MNKFNTNLYNGLVFLSMFVGKILNPSSVFAEQYGQGGVVLGDGSTTVAHDSVNAGFAEDLALISASFIVLAGIFSYFHKKLNKFLQI